ncbi:MAG TPA: aminoglycoside phosphotransferase family protein [Mobilitalea sp.]|nr:aminoglycoside phosphotransferase family protein [Mobilitalea sp.]
MKLPETDVKNVAERFMKTQLNKNDEIEVSDVNYINIGNENDVYSFIAGIKTDGIIVKKDLIIRIFAGFYADERAKNEYSNLQKLKIAGYPVPELSGMDLSGIYIDRPFFIMERIIGKNLHDALNNADEKTYDRLMDAWIELFIDLHKLDCSDFKEGGFFLKTLFPYVSIFDQEHPFSSIDNYINSCKFLLNIYHGENEFSKPLEWLEEHKFEVPCVKPSVIHQDFNDNNILVDNLEKLYVIDWSGMDISDFRLDLASVIQVWTKYKDLKLRDRILSTYEKMSGSSVDHIEYFEAAACLRKILLASVSLNNNINKHGIKSNDEVNQELLQYQSTYNYWLKITGISIPLMENVNTSSN